MRTGSIAWRLMVLVLAVQLGCTSIGSETGAECGEEATWLDGFLLEASKDKSVWQDVFDDLIDPRFDGPMVEVFLNDWRAGDSYQVLFLECTPLREGGTYLDTVVATPRLGKVRVKATFANGKPKRFHFWVYSMLNSEA